MSHNPPVRTSSAWRTWFGLAAAILLLNASLAFESAWPTPGVRWRGALSIELAVLVLALVAMRSRLAASVQAAARWLAVVWLVLVVGRYADVTSAALYGREINLFWDLRFVPDVMALLARPEKLWVIGAAGLAVAVLAVLTYVLVRGSIRRVIDATNRPAERRALGVLAALVVACWGAAKLGFELPVRPIFAAPVVQTYARQARLLAISLTGSTVVAASPPMSSDFSLVRGADVFLVFIEAYGAVTFERPELASRLTAERTALDAAIHGTGRDVVSAYVESPTFGGSSWLAHITLLSGVEVRDHETNALLMREKRHTLVTSFAEHGYRTVAVMPGLWQAWPEGSFYGFDEIYGGMRLDYHGPAFGWWDITDQYAFAKMDSLEVDRQGRPPLFVFFPTISTHIPFTPTPPYQPDWGRMLSAKPYDDAEVIEAYDRQPDWMDLGPSYADAVSYAYRSIAGYLRLRGNRDFVMILIGDHEPAAAVSGEGASWDVPVHVVASRTAVLQRLEVEGFRRGLTPARPSLGPMNKLTLGVLRAMGNPEAAGGAVVAPVTPK